MVRSPVKMDHWYRIPDYESPTAPINNTSQPPNSLNPLNNSLPNSLSHGDGDNKGNLLRAQAKVMVENRHESAGGGHGPARHSY